MHLRGGPMILLMPLLFSTQTALATPTLPIVKNQAGSAHERKSQVEYKEEDGIDMLKGGALTIGLGVVAVGTELWLRAQPPRGPYNRRIYRSAAEHAKLEEFGRILGAKLAEGISGVDDLDLAHRWFDCVEDKVKSEFQTDDTGADNIVAQQLLGKPWPETVEPLKKFDTECRKKLKDEVRRQQEQQLRNAYGEHLAEPMQQPEGERKKEDGWDDHIFNFANNAAEKLGKVIRNSGKHGGVTPSWPKMGNALPRFSMGGRLIL
ncbi:MAG: hypothetical protein M1816_003275 [Peltula sp. TS41687]|nr:MAG: hypothetical protein M1816_003275 [Peltula sp. TS41687]